MELQMTSARLMSAGIRAIRGMESVNEKINITQIVTTMTSILQIWKRPTLYQCLLYGYMRTNLEKHKDFLVYREDDTA